MSVGKPYIMQLLVCIVLDSPVYHATRMVAVAVDIAALVTAYHTRIYSQHKVLYLWERSSRTLSSLYSLDLHFSLT
jgi:hypothetical protein